MTKLVVISDSHNDSAAIKRILRQEKGVSAVIFLGDGVKDLDLAMTEHASLRAYVVSGNCDFGAMEPPEGLAAFDGVLIFYTHGHLYGVKSGLDRLAETAKARGADVALFGHTHTPANETVDGVLLFNPGSCSYGAMAPAGYGVLTLEAGKVLAAEHKPMPRPGL